MQSSIFKSRKTNKQKILREGEPSRGREFQADFPAEIVSSKQFRFALGEQFFSNWVKCRVFVIETRENISIELAASLCARRQTSSRA